MTVIYYLRKINIDFKIIKTNAKVTVMSVKKKKTKMIAEFRFKILQIFEFTSIMT